MVITGANGPPGALTGAWAVPPCAPDTLGPKAENGPGYPDVPPAEERVEADAKPAPPTDDSCRPLTCVACEPATPGRKPSKPPKGARKQPAVAPVQPCADC